MLRQLVIVTVVVSALLAVALFLVNGGNSSAALVSAVSALALVLGAWCAPASYRAPLFGSPRDWPRGRARTKILQLVIGALVTVVATVSFDAIGAVWGIAAALVVGSVAGDRRDAERGRE